MSKPKQSTVIFIQTVLISVLVTGIVGFVAGARYQSHVSAEQVPKVQPAE